MDRPRRLPLRDLQPSQLYVSRAKLEAVEAAVDLETLDPLPVRRYGDHLVLTDGHTRALAAHRAGRADVLVVRDEDDLDDEAYEVCVGWCLEDEVRCVADLDDRVVSPEDYERLWLDRCRVLHRRLEAEWQGDTGP